MRFFGHKEKNVELLWDGIELFCFSSVLSSSILKASVFLFVLFCFLLFLLFFFLGWGGSDKVYPKQDKELRIANRWSEAN